MRRHERRVVPITPRLMTITQEAFDAAEEGEKEWAMTFPQYAISKWVGHSITVLGEHYANDVPDELFDRAAEALKSEAVQNPAQQSAASPRTASPGPDPVASQRMHKSPACEDLQVGATSCEEVEEWTRSQRI